MAGKASPVELLRGESAGSLVGVIDPLDERRGSLPVRPSIASPGPTLDPVLGVGFLLDACQQHRFGHHRRRQRHYQQQHHRRETATVARGIVVLPLRMGHAARAWREVGGRCRT
jgi:hypothetical protein